MSFAASTIISDVSNSYELQTSFDAIFLLNKDVNTKNKVKFTE